MPRRPKDRSNPDGFSIAGQPKGNKSGVMQRPAKEKKGYKGSPLLLTQEIAKNDTWGPDQIDARQAVMAATALDIWKL